MAVLAQSCGPAVFIPLHTHVGQTCSLSNQFQIWGHTVHTWVYAQAKAGVHFFIFPQVANHRIKDEPAAVDRLMRRMCTCNHRCYWKYAFFPETQKWCKWEQEPCWCLLPYEVGAGGESIGFATVTIDHEHNISLQCHLSPTSRVTGTLRGAELNAQWSDNVFTWAWEIYHLPLCDAGSKRHWDKQYVKCVCELTHGDCCCVTRSLKLFSSHGEMNSLNDFK